jgi:hypothetical protein
LDIHGWSVLIPLRMNDMLSNSYLANAVVDF